MSASPSTSPPRTPDDNRNPAAKPHPTSTTPNSDDSSIIDDLSFDYVFDQDGNYVRLSKGSSSKSNNSSPPTPQDAPLQPEFSGLKLSSPKLSSSPLARASLSRSESAYPVLSGPSVGTSSTIAPSATERPTRSFQRVASGPAIAMTPSYAAPTTSSSSKPRTAPRRITMEDPRERHEPPSRARQTLDSSHPYTHQEEKENISESDESPYALPNIPAKTRHSPPLTSHSISRLPPSRTAYGVGTRPLAEVSLSQRNPHARQILPGPNRAGRIMKNASSSSKYTSTPSAAISGFDRISEVETSENEYPAEQIGVALGGEETEGEDEPVEPASIPLPSSGPSSSSQLTSGRLRSHATTNGNIGSTLSQSGNTRPRRSASLSDALAHDDYQLQLQQHYREPNSRPGTSLGLNANADNTAGARRIPLEERNRQEMEMRAKYRREEEEVDRREQESNYQQSRQSPSPTHQPTPPTSRPLYGHRRRDSDTLRSLAPLSGTSLGSPTAMDLPPLSAGGRLQGRTSPPNSKLGRASPAENGLRVRVSPPTTKGRISPPTSKGRVSPPSSRLGREVAKHRRSPTAPEPPTTSGVLGGTGGQANGKTWAAGSEREEDYDYGTASERERERERDRERERERERRAQASIAPPVSAPPVPAPIPVAAAAPPPPPAQLNRHIVVNKKAYARLDMIGKGGSSRVFRVLNHANELYAIKRVSLDKTDAETMNGYMNEISLLKRLEGNSRIIRLIDSELRAGPGGSKGHLLLVMECGEIDLARLLQEQMKEKVNMVWVAYYWQQMLQAVHVIHEEKIVHSDLKPANFVLVRGQLKLIDFGIANAIANDTTNIQRDHQIGTVNYMSPEAIELPDGMRRLKVGRPSDVWSLGCILYQMIYGHPPFQHLSVYQKMKAIPDMSHIIEFPEYATPSVPAPRNSGDGSLMAEQPKKLDHLTTRVRSDVIDSMKNCLVRNPKERGTIPDLLKRDWLSMKEPEAPAVKDLLASDETVINPYYMRQLLQYGIKLGEAQNGGMDAETLLREAERLVAELKSIQ